MSSVSKRIIKSVISCNEKADKLRQESSIHSFNQSPSNSNLIDIPKVATKEENRIINESKISIKRLYMAQSIYELDNKARMDAGSSINPLMMVDYVFEHLSKIAKQAYDVYNTEECDQEKAYVLYKTFLLIYKDIRKTKEFQELEPKDIPVKKAAYYAHITMDVLLPELDKRYLELQKSQIYAQASRIATRLTLNSSENYSEKRITNNSLANNENQISKSNFRANKNSSKVKYTPDKCYQCGNYEFVINVGERGYVMLQGNNLQATKAARLVLQNFIKWGMSKQIGNKKTDEKDESVSIVQKEKSLASIDKIRAYNRRELLLIGKSTNKKNSLEGVITDPYTPPVFPNYVQSIFMADSCGIKQLGSASNEVKTIR